jgi:hypothetical protein
MSMDVGRAAIDRHDPERAKVVRYEDLLAGTASELAGLFAWLGIARRTAEIEAIAGRHSFANAGDSGELRRNRSARPGRWRENLSEREVGIVTGIAGERLERYGYAG